MSLATRASDLAGRLASEFKVRGFGLVNYPNDAARNAAPGLFAGQRCTTNGVVFRWNGNAWKLWEWQGVSGLGSAENGSNFDTSGGIFEGNVIAGELVLNYNVYKSAGLAINQSIMRIQSPFLPANSINNPCLIGSSSAHGVGTAILDNTGGLIISSGTISPFTYARGTLSYRIDH